MSTLRYYARDILRCSKAETTFGFVTSAFLFVSLPTLVIILGLAALIS
jgi:hypothetical protein